MASPSCRPFRESGRPTGGRPRLGHLPGDVFGALAQLGLLARELLQLALALLLRERRTGQILLASQQLVLPPRQILDPIERLGGVGLRSLAAPRRFVAGLLLALQLAIEQGRDVVVAIGIARRPGRRLVHAQLPALDVGLRLQQVIEGLHLRRQRLAGLERLERRHGAAHRIGGSGHRVFLRPQLSRGDAGLAAARIPHRGFAEGARRLLDERHQIGLRGRERADVAAGLRSARVLGTAIQFPRGDDDLALSVDQLVERAAVPGPRHRLALSERKFLLGTA